MTLTRSNDGAWSVAAAQPITYKVMRIDDVLTKTFPLGCFPPDQDPLGRAPGRSNRRLVVVDRQVMSHYGNQIRSYLDRHGLDYRIVTIRGGEATKQMRTALRLCRVFDDFGISRLGPPIISFVGGVGSDVLGLAASLYRRGVSRIEYPTTLVAAIDASIGIKTAIDFNGFKNRLGTYSARDLVIIDRRFLATLARRRHSDGLGEIHKLGVGVDARLFELLEQHGALVLDEAFQGRTAVGDDAAGAIFDRSIDATLSELEPNLLELNAARATYLGHTFSPPIEMAALIASRSWLLWRRRRSLLHGEAVALDTVLSSALALHRHLITADEYHRIADVARLLELPTWDPLLNDPQLLQKGLDDSTRHRGGRQLAPLPSGIGKVVFVDDLTLEELQTAVTRVQATHRAHLN